MSYRLSSAQIKPLIWVQVQMEKHAHSRVEYIVKVCNFSILSRLIFYLNIYSKNFILLSFIILSFVEYI